MSRAAPPMRFLALVAGGWVGLRAAFLVPGWWVEEGAVAPAPDRAVAARPGAQTNSVDEMEVMRLPQYQDRPRSPQSVLLARLPRSLGHAARTNPTAGPVGMPAAMLFGPRPAVDSTAWPLLSQPPRLTVPSRWTGSAWLLLRPEEGAGLAPGGTLGGSQAGIRLAFRVSGSPQRQLALSARLYAPVARRSGAEAALGLDWRPSAALPVHIVAERRQALGRDGRSAFAVGVHGGVGGRRLPAGLRLDAFGQAGVVGARSRDLYADGSARVTMPAGRLEVGAGIWGGAQPGASRLDAGPHVSMRLPLAGETVRVSAEWRFRIAGDARPGSGPALSVGTDF